MNNDQTVCEPKATEQPETVVDCSPSTCSLPFADRLADHEKFTREERPPLNSAGKEDWMHPDFSRCSNDWWQLEVCEHCKNDGGCVNRSQRLIKESFGENSQITSSE
tara:strand:- start:169 stop:489 length:321 start_codon:yes stop_codon:yes gene_type:complete